MVFLIATVMSIFRLKAFFWRNARDDSSLEGLTPSFLSSIKIFQLVQRFPKSETLGGGV